jgi:hypothetical protein
MITGAPHAPDVSVIEVASMAGRQLQVKMSIVPTATHVVVLGQATPEIDRLSFCARAIWVGELHMPPVSVHPDVCDTATHLPICVHAADAPVGSPCRTPGSAVAVPQDPDVSVADIRCQVDSVTA